MNLPTNRVFGAELDRIKPELSQALLESTEQLIYDFLEGHLERFHSLPPEERWDVYARGGYLKGVESNKPYQNMQQQVLDSLALESDSSLLVLGCGSGYLENLALQQSVDCKRITSVDGSEQMLSLLKKRIDVTSAAIEVIQADLNEADTYQNLPAPSYDRVAIVNTLEFLDIPRFVAQLETVTSDDCRVVVVTPKPDVRHYLPAMREHLELSGIDLGGEFWDGVFSELEAIHNDIFEIDEARGLILNPARLSMDNFMKRYLHKFSKILARITQTLSHQGVTQENLEAICIMGLANSIPPAILNCMEDGPLKEYFGQQGFDWQKTTITNAGISRLMEFKQS